MKRVLTRSSMVKGVLIDIHGVLYESGLNRAIEGSVEAFIKLKESKIPFKLVTNETQNTRKGLVEKLRSYGFESLQVSDIVAPAPAARSYLEKHNLRPHLLVHEGEYYKSDPNCVLIGDAGERFTYENLNNAFRLLIEMKEPVLISLGKGRYYKEQGKLTMDNGPYTAALEHACGINATVIGKPSPEFFFSVLEMINVKPEDAVMIGDDLISDVGAAQELDISGILVKTGKFTAARDLQHPKVKPDKIVENLLEAIEKIAN